MSANRDNQAFALYVFGLILFLGGLYHLIQQVQTYTWSTTSGVVIESMIVKERIVSEPGASPKAKVVYQYTVADHAYASDTLAYGFVVLNIGWNAARIADNFPVGEKVQVYYNPESPSESVLSQGISWFVVAELCIGLLLFYMGFRRSRG